MMAFPVGCGFCSSTIAYLEAYTVHSSYGGAEDDGSFKIGI